MYLSTDLYNLKYYPWYRALTASMAWLPIFFLFFSEILSLREVLLLESIYYISVVLLEVPSGYFSDVAGRRITLLTSSIMFSIAYIVFATSTTFWSLTLAQILLAGAISFRSGTDTVLHYESLLEVNKGDEYGAREAKVGTLCQLMSALAVLLGGLFGAISLNLPYWLSFVIVIPAVWICHSFQEPKKIEIETNVNFITQLKICLRYLKGGYLAWIFGYAILMYAITHIPYEFYQPYLHILETEGRLLTFDVAVVSGILFAATRLLGAVGAKYSIVLRDRFGFYNLLFGAIIVQLLIIGVMGTIVHPFIILILLLRNFSMSLTEAPINAAIAPLIQAKQRATYFSIQSLISRLSFAVILTLLALPFENTNAADWEALSSILWYSLLGSIFFTIILYGTRLIQTKNP